MQSLRTYFLSDNTHYAVLIFHENLTSSQLTTLQKLVPVPLQGVLLNDFLTLPAFAEQKIEQIHRWNCGLDGGRKTNLGYIQMCRFFSWQLYDHPVLAPYDYYWRFDDDSFLLSPIAYDPFEFMHTHQLVYGYRCKKYENVREICGLQELWQATQIFARDHKISLFGAYRLTCNVLGRYKGMNFYNNFEINSLQFWRSQPLHRAYCQFLDQSLGFYRYRWGDANVRTLALGLFAKQSQIHHFKDINYRHNDHYAIPNKAQIIYSKEG